VNAREHDVLVNRAWMVAGAIILVVAVGLAIRQGQPGVGGQPSGAPTASGVPSGAASASAPASEAPAAEPSVPAPTPVGSMRPAQPVTATAEENGIRVTLTLDRDRIVYGERAWADVTVVNTGSDNVYWGHSGTCEFAASVDVITTVPVDLGYGRDDWPGNLGILKLITVTSNEYGHPEGRSLAPGEAVAGFTPEPWVDVDATVGCTTDLVTDEVVPGAQLTYRAAWEGDGPHDVPLRPGAYVVESVFSYLNRGAAPVNETPWKHVAVDVPFSVEGLPVDYLGPGEAVDRVLGDASFLALFEDAPREHWNGSTLWFEDGVWVMRLYRERLGGAAILARVNAISGAVLTVELDPDPPEPRW
jgi:hypothetical protein